MSSENFKLFSIWMDTPNYLNDINETVTQVIVDNTVEIEYAQLQGDVDGLKKLLDKCRTYNVPVTLLTASSTYNKLIDEESLRGVTVVDDPCFWIAKHASMMLGGNNIKINIERGYDIFDNNAGLAENIQYLYITMNNRIKLHRAQMMDILAKYYLIDLGAVGWKNDNCFNTRYQYKYWEPTPLYLDCNIHDDINQDILPIEFKHSFMQLVAESEEEKFMISEKTAVPLLFNKPFLVVSCKNFHKNLQELGFQIYDEVFDYGFDSIDDQYTRVVEVVKNVHRLRKYDNTQLQELTEQLRPKLRHNRQLAINYLKRTSNMFKSYYDTITRQGYVSRLEPIVATNLAMNLNKFKK